MGSIIRHGDKWRAVVRKKGYPTKTKVWSKKAQASQWVKEIELAMEKQELASSNVEISKLIEKYLEEIEPLRPGRRQNQRNYKALAKVTRGLYLSTYLPLASSNGFKPRGKASRGDSRDRRVDDQLGAQDC